MIFERLSEMSGAELGVFLTFVAIALVVACHLAYCFYWEVIRNDLSHGGRRRCYVKTEWR